MIKSIQEKLIESLKAVLPMTIIVTIISFIIGLDIKLILAFILGAIFLIIGLAVFSMGAEESMMALASEIGSSLIKTKKIWLIVGIIFVVGFLITISEPALWVLGEQFKNVVNPLIFIFVISIGVGIFVVLAILRIIFQFKLRTLILIGYALVFGVVIIVSFINPSFVPVAFDSGGATTGPMAVPFLMSLAYGFSLARGDEDSRGDAFGLVGIASIGPILAVLVLGLFFKPSIPTIDITSTFIDYFILNLFQMLIAIIPFIVFFIIFQVFVFKYTFDRVIKILVAFIYVYIGLVIFLTGANAGLVNMAHALGSYFAGTNYSWIIIPLGMLFGYISIAAEPSVIVLNKLVEDVSGGAVSKKMMFFSLSVGVAIAVGLANIRVLTGLNIWWILGPVYLIIVIMLFFTPKIFYAIAIDSGGAVSGALTSAFLVPFTFGAGEVLNANILTDAFGLVAFVAMTPLVTIQILGLVYKYRRSDKLALKEVIDDKIIDIESEEA